MKIFRRIVIVLVAVCIDFLGGRAQGSAWKQSSQWTIYNIGGTKFYKVRLDSLGNCKHRLLNDDSMHVFLAQSSSLASKEPPMWMGAFVATCIIDNKKRKIDISSYGGFFFDEADKKYYSVAPETMPNWLNYFANCYEAIVGKKEDR